MSAPIDPGLQPERTLLAWRRTCLTLAVGLAVAIRFSDFFDPLAALLIGIPALAAVGGAYVATSLRYRSAARAFAHDPERLRSGGRAIAAVALISLVLGVFGLGFVLAGISL